MNYKLDGYWHSFIAEGTRPRQRRGFSTRWNFGLRMTACPHCAAIMWIEERVRNSSIGNPRFNLCCQSGQISVPLLPPSPPYLESLLTTQHFLDKIRIYNSMFSFTSMGGRIDNSVNNGRSACVSDKWQQSPQNWNVASTIWIHPKVCSVIYIWHQQWVKLTEYTWAVWLLLYKRWHYTKIARNVGLG